jgi:hypothetical protein
MSDGFLSRWSRRKRGLEQAAPAPEVPDAPPRPTPAPVEEEFDLASLPPLESLGAGSDLSAFLHAKVPALLRQAALRRVWAADPGIRDFMGPADYAWDYNDPNGVPGFALSLGDVDLKKLLAQAIGAPEETPEDASEETPEDNTAEPDAAMMADAPVLPPPDDPVRLTVAPPAEPAPPPLSLAEEAEPLPQAAPRRHGGAMPRVG